MLVLDAVFALAQLLLTVWMLLGQLSHDTLEAICFYGEMCMLVSRSDHVPTDQDADKG